MDDDRVTQGLISAILAAVKILYLFSQWLQPYIVPICAILAWGLVYLVVHRVVQTIRDTAAQAKQMHQIPCADCQFYSGDYHLKCPVHPHTALTEAAIGCRDFAASSR